jgi:hypothetical protein
VLTRNSPEGNFSCSGGSSKTLNLTRIPMITGSNAIGGPTVLVFRDFSRRQQGECHDVS